MHVHRHTHTHKQTHTYIHKHIHTLTYTHAHTHIRMHTHTYTQAHTPAIIPRGIKTQSFIKLRKLVTKQHRIYTVFLSPVSRRFLLDCFILALIPQSQCMVILCPVFSEFLINDCPISLIIRTQVSAFCDQCRP
jgi:hypothetical protein